MLKQVDGKWAIVSDRTLKPMAFYEGYGKPPVSWVHKVEWMLEGYKHGLSAEILEASYQGNVGIMELVKFHQKANDEQKKQLKDHMQNNRHELAWKLVQDVTKTKLHSSVMGEQTSPDILPKAGAGQEGTDELLNTYIKDTPGQGRKFLKFKQYKK